MTTSFRQTTPTDTSGYDYYLWSSSANWTNGVPGNGASATVNVSGGGNPSGLDDIASLFLATLYQESGYTSVEGDLQIGSLSFGPPYTEVYSSTLTGTSSARLTVDGFSGSNIGEVGAFGSGAVTDVVAPADPGEIYQAGDGGEVVLSAAPHGPTAAGGFYYEGYGGTFAFDAPGGAVGDQVVDAAIGDSIALPGSDVISVSYGASSIVVVTNLGTTDFTDVSFSGTAPTGYSVSTDPTGLERITFAAQQATSFRQTTPTDTSGYDYYLWSSSANWTNGVPGNGAAATVNVSGGGNPSGLDDIASLFLAALYQESGYTSVEGDLQIGSLSFGPPYTEVYSSTLTGTSSARLTVDGFSGSNIGEVGAFGSGAVTDVVAPADPGEIYQVGDGGEVVLSAAPHGPTAAGGFYYEGYGGTFAFDAPGGAVGDQVVDAAIGDSIALPGSDVISVSYGASSIVVVTNLGTTDFTDVSFSGTAPTGYSVSTDPTGLERIAFTACYAAGTRILTAEGEVAIELLVPGNRVIAASGGERDVIWTGHRKVDLLHHPCPCDVMPVRVRAHAFAPNQPSRDLILSPDHAVYAEGRLVPIRHLLNGTSVVQEAAEHVTWWHVELPAHDIVLADGLPAESYLDTGNRRSFVNGNGTIDPQPGLIRTAEQAWANSACAPLAEDGAVVAIVRERLAARASVLGFASRRSAELCVARPGDYTIAVPGGVESLKLASSSGRVGTDRRRLGALVGGISIDGNAMSLDDPRIGAGFHLPENHGGTQVCWTSGEATLLLGPGAKVRHVEIKIACIAVPVIALAA